MCVNCECQNIDIESFEIFVSSGSKFDFVFGNQTAHELCAKSCAKRNFLDSSIYNMQFFYYGANFNPIEPFNNRLTILPLLVQIDSHIHKKMNSIYFVFPGLVDLSDSRCHRRVRFVWFVLISGTQTNFEWVMCDVHMYGCVKRAQKQIECVRNFSQRKQSQNNRHNSRKQFRTRANLIRFKKNIYIRISRMKEKDTNKMKENIYTQKY